MTGSFGGFLERIFHLFFFCWCQPSTPQPSPNRPIGLHIRNATAKIEKWHFESKNGIFNIKHKYWHGYQVFQVGIWTGVLMFNVKNPILDMKCHFFNFGCCTFKMHPWGRPLRLRAATMGLLGPGWGVLGCHQQKNWWKNFSPEIHQMSQSSAVKVWGPIPMYYFIRCHNNMEKPLC